MGLIKPPTAGSSSAVVKTTLKKAAPSAAAGGSVVEGCKWCDQGECWTHGQIEKPKGFGKGKGKGKGFGGGGFGGGGFGGGGGLMEMVTAMALTGGSGGGLLAGLLGGGGGGFGGGYGGGYGGGKGSWGKGGGSWGGNFKLDKSGGELGEFTGTIKSFNEKTNYGFIQCAEIDQGDVFLHGDMKKGYQQGMKVKFTCVLNKDGKPVAIDLKSGLK